MKDLSSKSRVNPHFPNFVMIPQIIALASTGFSKRGIARHYQVSEETLNRWFDEDETLQEAFMQGREQERQALHNVLYKLAIDEKDKVSAMFLLKSRHGYREGDQQDNPTGSASRSTSPAQCQQRNTKRLKLLPTRKSQRCRTMASETIKLNAFQQRLLTVPEEFDVFLGGGRGGGKSYGIAYLILRHVSNTASRHVCFICARATKGSRTSN